MMYDAIIVGGGPAGLSAALVLGRALRRVLLIDAGNPRNRAAETLNGYLGFDGRKPSDLAAQGQAEIEKYHVEFCRDEVNNVAHSKDCNEGKTLFAVTTLGGRTERCRKVLFATGLTDLLPDVPGLRDFYGTRVHHCPYCDGYEHRSQHLLALGTSAHKAAGLAVSLRSWSDQITVLANGDALTDEDRRRLQRNGIQWNDQRVTEVYGDREGQFGVRLQDGQTIPAGALFFNTDCFANCDLPKSLGCEFRDPALAATSRKQQTNVPGLFVAGDADGDVQFVIVAAAEGAKAAVAINRELQDEDRLE